MKRRKELTILCRNRKCRNPIKVTVTLDISFLHVKDGVNIYRVGIENVTNNNCKKCRQRVHALGPLIGSVI